MTTTRQKEALDFCHSWGFPKYIGDKEDFKQVSQYLSKYLDKAKKAFSNNKKEEEWEDFMINCGDIGIDNTY